MVRTDWTARLGARVTPRDLYVFLAVAETGNISKAAEKLSMSRPVVSRTLAAVERALAAPLFDRVARGVALSVYGRQLARHAVIVLDELQRAAEAVQAIRDPGAGRVIYATSEVWAAGLAAAAVEAAQRTAPGLSFVEHSVTPATLQDYLRTRRGELVITRQVPGLETADIEIEPLFREELIIVTGAENPLQARPRLRLADLVSASWIVSSFEFDTGSPFVQAFMDEKLQLPSARILSNSINSRLALLTRSHYVTMVPGSLLTYSPFKSLLRPLPIRISRWSLPVAIFKLRAVTMSPAAELFIEMVRAEAGKITRLSA